MNRFIGREAEIRQVQDLVRGSQSGLLVVTGRRRSGKTHLLLEACDAARPRLFYWRASVSSAAGQLALFSKSLAQFAASLPEGPGFSIPFPGWLEAFMALGTLALVERAVVILDDFPRLLAADPDILAELETAWGQRLRQSNLLLILAGVRLELGQKLPADERCTLLELAPLPFTAVRHFFPAYAPLDRARLYMLLGGVPGYWQKIDPYLILDDNLRKQFLALDSLFWDEPRLLLQDFFQDLHNYTAVMQAVGRGAYTPKPIADGSGLPEKHVPQYLSLLQQAGLVTRRLPLHQPEKPRSGRHVLADPFLRFYYGLLAEEISQSAIDPATSWANLEKKMPAYLGGEPWQAFCQAWLDQAQRRGLAPLEIEETGLSWLGGSSKQVLMGIHRTKHILVVCECLWNPPARPAGVTALIDLVDKTPRFIPPIGSWRVAYLAFACGGWNNQAQTYARTITQYKINQGNWRAESMELLDLGQMVSDLESWE